MLSALALLGLLALPLASSAQQVRLGTEFRVNAYTPGYQRFASLAMKPDGAFVVVWASYAQDGSSYGVFGRRFSSSGIPLASEFQVNTYTTGDQQIPTVATSPAGDFVVVWNSTNQDGSVLGAFGRRFSASGAAVGAEFQVGARTTGSQRDAAVGFDANGNFVVVWESDGQDGAGYGVFGRQFLSGGTPVAAEFQVNTRTTGAQREPSVAVDATGAFVVAFESYGQDGYKYGIFARRFSTAGTPVNVEIAVNRYTTGIQRSPSVTRDPSGAFVIAWQSSGQDGSSYGVFAHLFTSIGYSIGDDFQVTTFTSGHQRLASLAGDAGGAFVVSWASEQDGYGSGIFARRFSSVGAALTGEFQVNTYTNSDQFSPVVGVAGGKLAIAWESIEQDAGTGGVYAQRFGFPLALDVDGDGTVGPLTDGLLALRYAFGFRGLTLTTGVVGPGCTRCTPAVIEMYLASLTN